MPQWHGEHISCDGEQPALEPVNLGLALLDLQSKLEQAEGDDPFVEAQPRLQRCV
jgi:hypothetical protein